MKHFFFTFFSVVFFVFPTFSLAADWTINNFNTDIIIQKDGVLNVKETIDVDFGTISKHGIFRNIPLEYINKDGNIVKMNFQLLSITDKKEKRNYNKDISDGTIHIRIGDSDKKVLGKQTYIITYAVSGVLAEYPIYDELYWNTTGNEWNTEIQKSSASVTVPDGDIIQGSCYFGVNGAKSSCVNATSTGRIINFHTVNPLEIGEGMTISAGFTKGIVPIIAPMIEKTQNTPTETNHFNLRNFIISLLFALFIALSFIYRTWKKKGRDKDSQGKYAPIFGNKTIIAEYETPLGLRPGELGTLIDETADTLDITATIVDLAVRGYLIIEEIPKQWFLGSTDYRLTKTKLDTKNLLPYEIKLLEALFRNRPDFDLSGLFNSILKEDINKKAKTEIKVSDLKSIFYADLALIKKSLYETVTEKKLFEASPGVTRGKYIMYSIGFIVLGIFIPLVFQKANFSIFSGLGLGFIISGFIFLFVATFAMAQKSVLGYETSLKARGYKLFISETEKYRASFYEKENMFMEILPYAIVFGVTDKLAKAMKDIGVNPPQPSWYHSSTPFNASLFATNMHNFSSSLSSTLASAPSSSGSGGGGSSGGGFGGGGGGSW